MPFAWVRALQAADLSGEMIFEQHPVTRAPLRRALSYTFRFHPVASASSQSNHHPINPAVMYISSYIISYKHSHHFSLAPRFHYTAAKKQNKKSLLSFA